MAEDLAAAVFAPSAEDSAVIDTKSPIAAGSDGADTSVEQVGLSAEVAGETAGDSSEPSGDEETGDTAAPANHPTHIPRRLSLIKPEPVPSAGAATQKPGEPAPPPPPPKKPGVLGAIGQILATPLGLKKEDVVAPPGGLNLPNSKASLHQNGYGQNVGTAPVSKVAGSPVAHRRGSVGRGSVEFIAGEEVEKIGLAFRTMPPKLLVIEQVTGGTWADEKGIEPGDVFVAVNGKDVKELTKDEFMKMMTERPLSMRIGPPTLEAEDVEASPPMSRKMGADAGQVDLKRPFRS